MAFLFKVKGPTGIATVSLHDTCTFSDLQSELEEKLPVLESYEDGTCNYDIMVGFPPKPLTLQPQDMIKGHLQSNEAIRVQLKEVSGKQAQGRGPITVPNRKRQKVSVTSSSDGEKPSSNVGFGVRIATIGSSSSSSSSSSRQVAKASTPQLIPFGNRIASLNSSSSLRGGVKISANARKKQSVRRVSAKDSASNEADISIHLMEAVSGGTGKRNKVLRDVFRKAVEHQYNSAKALGRLHAVYSGNYHIQENPNVRLLGSGAVKQIDVRFHRGTGSRTFYEETVDLLPDETLMVLLKLALEDQEGMGREVLKPMNLSKCSPRIFWSLVYSHGQNLIHTIKTMLEGIDGCEWLTERKRELSEKAKENERQQKAKAEEQRLRREQRNKKRSAPEPAEENADTEAEAQNVGDPKAVFLELLNGAMSKLTFEEDDMVWLRMLSFVDLVPENYYAVLAATLTSSSILSLALSPSKELHASLCSIDETLSCEQVETWIESAKYALLQYVWYTICGHGCERLRIALKKLRIRSPKEMISAWKNIPTALFNGLLKLDAGLGEIPCKWPRRAVTAADSEDTAAMKSGVFTEDCVKWMIGICTKVSSDFPFARDYTEIIVDDEETEDTEVVDSEEVWTTDPAVNPLLGKRCRIIVREMLSGLEAKNEEDGEIFFWEDGVVHSYLPSTPEEPMALWKVLIDSTSKVVNGAKLLSPPRYEDLEEVEVAMAIKRIETCNFC